MKCVWAMSAGYDFTAGILMQVLGRARCRCLLGREGGATPPFAVYRVLHQVILPLVLNKSGQAGGQVRMAS